MQRYGTSLVVVLVAVLALSWGAATATALRSIQLSGTISEERSRALTFTEAGQRFRVICEVTKAITLNERIAKITGAAFGVATVEVRSCTGGNVRVLGTRWPMSFVSFAGTLPNIREITSQVERVEFLVENFFGAAECLYSGAIQLISSGNPLTSETVNETREVSLARSELSSVRCPGRARMKGTFDHRNAFTITLV
jgi:hypothetical protein